MATVEEEQKVTVSLVTPVNNVLHSFFSIIELYINNQQIYISKNFKRAIFEYKAVLHCTRYDYEQYPDEIMESSLSELFSRRRMKMLSKPHGFMVFGKLGIEIFSTSQLLYPKMKARLRLISAGLISTWLATTPTLVSELSVVHFTLVVLLSRMNITRIEWTCLLILVWSSTLWKLLQKFSSFPPDKTS